MDMIDSFCMNHSFNSLRPSDAIWRQWSWTTLAQVMACCLTAPSHYLNQCWLITRGVLWHTSESSFAGIAQGIDSGYEFEKDILKNIFKSPRGQWVNSFMSHVAIYISNVLRKKKQYHKLSKEFIHNSIMYYTCELFLWYFCNLVCPIIGYCIIGCCLIVYPIHHLFISSLPVSHYNDVIITTMSSQITSLAIVYTTVYSDTDQRKHQSSGSLASNGENVSIWWRHHENDNLCMTGVLKMIQLSLHYVITSHFHLDTHNRHPIAHPWGWTVGCLLWIHDTLFLENIDIKKKHHMQKSH